MYCEVQRLPRSQPTLPENRNGDHSLGRSERSDAGQVDLEWLRAIADPIRIHIVRVLSQVDEATAAELARDGAASHPTLRRHLAALTVSGVVRERPGQSDGETPGRPAARFSLAPGVRGSVRSVLAVLA